jgi:uncharacterized protein (UPF0335 family)
LKLTLAGFGIQNTDQELFVHATAENFPYKKHNLIQAICAVIKLRALPTATRQEQESILELYSHALGME